MAVSTTSLSEIYVETIKAIKILKSVLQSQVASMAAGNVNASTILGVYVRLKRDHDAFASVASIPGMPQYAKDQTDDQLYDIASEFTAMQSAITDAIAWVDANFPAAGGYIQSHQISGGVITERNFTPTQTAGFRTVLNSVIAMIN